MLLDDVAQYLIAQGAVTTGWVLTKSFLPDDQDQAIAIYETAGKGFDTQARENIRPGLMMRVRAARLDYQTARNKWQTVFDLLQDAQEIPGSPTLLPGYTFIMSDQTAPMPFQDDKGRPNLSANFRVMKARNS